MRDLRGLRDVVDASKFSRSQSRFVYQEFYIFKVANTAERHKDTASRCKIIIYLREEPAETSVVLVSHPYLVTVGWLKPPERRIENYQIKTTRHRFKYITLDYVHFF